MPRIVIVGALAWDRPIWLDKPLASGGRPSGVSLGGNLQGRLGGGAANAGVALALAGHIVMPLSVVFDDETGRAILDAALGAGLRLEAVARLEGRSRTTLILIEPSGERIVLGLDTPAVSLADTAGYHQHLRTAIDSAPDAVFIRSPLPGSIDLLHAARGPALVHWPTSPDVLAAASSLVGSADDLPAAAASSPLGYARSLGAKNARAAILTAGAGPIILEDADGRREIAAHPAASIVDTTGAGDTFAAGLLDALLAGASLDDAVRHASLWGAIAVGIEGSAAVGKPAGTFTAYQKMPI